jgi:hypothetical protein
MHPRKFRLDAGKDAGAPRLLRVGEGGLICVVSRFGSFMSVILGVGRYCLHAHAHGRLPINAASNCA